MRSSVIIDANFICHSQDVDAAIYLLGRLLNHKPLSGKLRNKLRTMRRRIKNTRKLSKAESDAIVTLYQEIMP